MSSSYFHKYQMYFSKVNVSVLPHCQRVYPNTHCSGNDKSKGSQWVLSDATHCSTNLEVNNLDGDQCDPSNSGTS